MEEFRSRLKRRMKVQIAFAAAFLVIIVGSTWLSFRIGREFSNTTDMMLGFQTGLCSSWMVMMLIGIMKIKKAMKDEKQCKRMYIEEHDERQKMIQLKTGKSAVIIGLSAMILAVYIAGFFNKVVFLTLMAVLVFFSFLVLGVQTYYNKTM